MKRTYPLFLSLLVCLVFAAAAAAQVGGPYDLSWNVIAGGSGKLTGGTFSLSGSVGQPATTVSSGGSLAVSGGFWTFPTPIPGDINGDGHVDMIDLLLLAGAWATHTGGVGYRAPCDITADGSIDVIDLLSLADTWGRY